MFVVQVQGQPGLIAAMKGMKEALDTRKILDEGAATIYNRIRSRFLIEQAPDGSKWPPSKAALRRARTGRGGGTLFDTGKMFRSIQLFADSATTRSIGTDVTSPKGFFYPEVHQFGIGFPQRQFLGFADDDLDVMKRVIMFRLARVFQKAAVNQPVQSGGGTSLI
jgi:phage gpG-like protein